MSVVKGNSVMLVTCAGYSMSPFLKDGDTAIIRRVNIDALHTGDIVAFRDVDTNQIVCHRLLGISTTADGVYMQTRGDAAGGPDAPIAARSLQGQVIALIRGSRTIQVTGGLRSWIGYIIVRSYRCISWARTVKRRIMFRATRVGVQGEERL